jgi:carboxyl-terminal processing protease
MLRAARYIFCSIILVTFASFLIGKENIPIQSHLSIADIRPTMEKILHQHVSQKKITPEIMQRACVLFFEQFDQHKVYLLDTEVEPFFKLSIHQLEAAIHDYEENGFLLFERMYKIINQAITRAQKNRASFCSNQEREPITSIPVESPAVYTSFCRLPEELKERQYVGFVHLMAQKWQRARSSYTSWTACAQDVDKESRHFEEEYLGLHQKEEKFAFHVLRALAASLDAHSTFFNREEAEDLKRRLEKSFEGIGLAIEDRDGSKVISSIVPNSPADRNGTIQPRDVLISVDRKPVKNLSLPEVMTLLHGHAGTTVYLELQRRGAYIGVTLSRKPIILQEGRVNAAFEKFQNGIIAKIALHAFYQSQEAGAVTSEEDVRKAIAELERNGRILGLLLDLRDNHGGFLMQAVKVAGLFIKSGVIVTCKYSDGSIHYFRDLDPGVTYSGPLVVLISKETASAAEIVAAALKDYGVAIVVGDERTYGKGSIQMQTVTNEQDADSLFKVTIGTYYGVNGESIQFRGVTADIVVPGVLAYQKIGEAYLENALTADAISPSFQDKLPDIPKQERSWYQKYYIPFLQEKSLRFRKWIPELTKKSVQRMEQNKLYQELLSKEKKVPPEGSNKEIRTALSEAELKELHQLQMQEAIAILKDLILLSSGSNVKID